MVHVTGDRIGPYEIVTLLGAGGMGTVYRARDVRLERDVALKFLHSSTDTAANLTRVLREARAASALNHPSICAVYDVGESDGDGYIAMEYVEGPALSARIPAGVCRRWKWCVSAFRLLTRLRMPMDVASSTATSRVPISCATMTTE